MESNSSAPLSTVGSSDVLVSELHKLAGSISDMVQKARASRGSYSLDQFLSSDARKESGGLYCLYPVQDYVSCFRALGVNDRSGLDALCRRRYAEPDVRDAAEALLQSEELFGEFVAEVDKEVKEVEDKLALGDVAGVGSSLPTALQLLDADSNRPIALGAILESAPFTLFVLKRHYI